MKCKWYQSHNWKDISTVEKSTFMGETVTENVPTKYRICLKCKSIQEYAYDSQGGTWYYLDEQRTKILKSKIDMNFVFTSNPNPKPPLVLKGMKGTK